jgi:cellulose biosynthesis protein BcsQ
VQRQSGESTSGFDVVLIDAPPRLTPGTINALVASTHLIVPTILDPLSAETVASFLQQAWTLREHMNLDIELAGIVGTMTPAQPLANDLREVQQAALAIVRTGLLQWHGDTHIFDRDIQDLAAIDRTAGQQVIYSEQNNKVFQMFTELGKQVCGRIRL